VKSTLQRKNREKAGLAPGGKIIATIDEGQIKHKPKPTALNLSRKT